MTTDVPQPSMDAYAELVRQWKARPEREREYVLSVIRSARCDPDTVGTLTAYVNHGCRCRTCREAWSRYKVEQRKNYTCSNKTRGTVSGYKQGCRCADCTEAKRIDAAFRRLDPETKRRENVRKTARDALRFGRLIKPHACECGRTGVPLECHHDDYDRPLDVRFLCRECHSEADRQRRARQLLGGLVA